LLTFNPLAPVYPITYSVFYILYYVQPIALYSHPPPTATTAQWQSDGGRSHRHTYLTKFNRYTYPPHTHSYYPSTHSSFTIFSHLSRHRIVSSHLTVTYGRPYNQRTKQRDKVQGRNWKQSVRNPPYAFDRTFHSKLSKEDDTSVTVLPPYNHGRPISFPLDSLKHSPIIHHSHHLTLISQLFFD